ncbi:hypothetical protein WA026_010859 [Henosepilachna vigintioctopunctata]|uniref:Protein sleepless n=1 Tax=Henosepilachna vigintioctopunctata TaxID=420089 RepID=A0AAW1UZC9_9CUCU
MILINILLVSLKLYCVYSISCYRCETTSSTIQSQCTDGPRYGEPEDCEKPSRANISSRANLQYTELKPKHCLKVTGVDTNGKEYIARGCIPHPGGTCEQVVNTKGFFLGVVGGVKNLQCYPCKEDECNSSLTVRSCLFIVLTIVIATSLFKF